MGEIQPALVNGKLRRSSGVPASLSLQLEVLNNRSITIIAIFTTAHGQNYSKKAKIIINIDVLSLQLTKLRTKQELFI